jgi:hypothetical protein
MNKKNNIQKPKFLPTINKQTKLSVQIQQKSLDLIYEYQNFLKEVSNAEVSPGSLVSAFINSAVTSDKIFVKWKKDKAEKAEQSTTLTEKKENDLLETDK